MINQPDHYRAVFVVLDMLARHHDDAISSRAQHALNHSTLSELFYQLARSADFINPYKRRDGSTYRQLCHNRAVKGDYRCTVAQLFYELSEGLYQRTQYVQPVMSYKRKLIL